MGEQEDGMAFTDSVAFVFSKLSPSERLHNVRQRRGLGR